MKEYIVPVNDDDIDDDELFIGYIRDHHKELIRCKDCRFWRYGDLDDVGYCVRFRRLPRAYSFCDEAERQEETK